MRCAGERLTGLILLGAFIALLAIPGLYHLRHGVGRGDLARYSAAMREAPPADAIRKIETDLDQRFVPAQAARTLLAGAPVKALRPTSPDTTRTADGNIFYAVDLQVPTTAGFLDRTFGNGQGAAEALAKLSKELAERNIHLLVVPVPAKASLYPESLQPDYDPARGPDLNPNHAEWIGLLQNSGVDVLDLTQLFWSLRHDPVLGPIYHPGDSHWSPNAVSLGAEQVAHHIRAFLRGTPTSPMEVRKKTIQRLGDLLSMDKPGDTYTPIVETVEQVLVRGVEGELGLINPGDEAPVLVLGDSFAAFYGEYGTAFHQQLARHLGGIPVQSAAITGAKADEIRAPLAESPGLLRSKKLVVLVYTIRLNICCQWHPLPVARGAAAKP